MDAYTKQCAEALPYVIEKLYTDFGIRVEPNPYTNDLITPIGAFPRGVLIELFGEKSVGKTTIVLSIIAALQKQKCNILYVDLDKTLFTYYMANMGITNEGLVVLKDINPEDAMENLIQLVSSGVLDFVVVDSVYNIPPHLLKKYLNRLFPLLGKTRTTVIFLNQRYVSMRQEIIPGGDVLKAYAQLRLSIDIIKKFKNVDGHYGNRVIIKSVKYRDGFNYTEREYKIYFGRGIVHENRG